MRTAFAGCAVVCALIGLVHIGYTFAAYDGLSLPAVWFAGAGLAVLLLPALNWAAWGERHPSAGVRRAALALDALMAVFAVVVVRVMPEPQVWVALASIVGMGVTGWALDRRAGR